MILPLAVLATLGFAPGPSVRAEVGSQGVRAREGTAIERILRRKGNDPRSRDRLVEELVDLGPGLIPTWFAWLGGQGFDAVFLAGDVYRPAEWMVRPEDAPDLALAVLGALSPEDVVGFLERDLRAGRPGTPTVLRALRVLEQLGSARGLELYWILIHQLDRDVFLPRLRQCADDALAAILARDRLAWPLVARRLQKPDPVDAELLTEAFRNAPRPEAHSLLLGLLDHSETSSERLDVVEGLFLVEGRFPWRFDGQAVRVLQRAWLGLAETDRFTAARLLGHGEDPEAIGPLFDLVEGSDPRARSAAQSALSELAGVSHGHDLEAWHHWHDRETAWWELESERLFLSLEADLPAGAAALGELGNHPLFRRRIAAHVAASLPYQKPELLPISCDFLVALGSRAALPGLMEIEAQVQDPGLVVQLRKGIAALSGQPFEEGVTGRRRLLGE